jgi:Iap family predicted aminopeptidase
VSAIIHIMKTRHRRPFIFLAASLLGCVGLQSATLAESRDRILGEAILGGGAYSFLETIADTYGPRMIGTEGHRLSLDYLESSLQELGIETRRQAFAFPGWFRGETSVELLGPVSRPLRAIAMGYVGTFTGVEGELAFVSSKDISEFDEEAIQDRILLVRRNVSYSLEDMRTLASEHGVKGMLYINRVRGGQLLARAANRAGEATPFPVIAVTQEEGLWMKRLLENEETVEVRISTENELKEFTGENLIATLPGESGERVILGGHFDSWDLGQGAVDNGLAVAQMYEVARLIGKHSPQLRHTIEFVWFDAEEVGLWGSYHYADAVELSDVRAMVNLDMVGRPIAINAMGFDGLVPVLENYAESLGAWKFDKPVANKPWLGSDHLPFILKGVPSITFNAPLDPEDVRYYHDFADTMDKVDPLMLGESTALIGLLMHHLANDEGDRVPQLSEEETAEMFRTAGLEERMRGRNAWPFGDAEAEE